MEQPAAHIDFETCSASDLRKVGMHRYAEDPLTFIWGFSWSIDGDMQPTQWRPGYPDPTRLLEHIAAGGLVKAHNAGFERQIWNKVLLTKYCTHWPSLPIAQQECTMARAAAIAYPNSLDKLCEVCGTHNRKDKEGHALMMQMAKPRRFNADGSVTWWDDADRQDRLMAYCDKDVLTECDVDLHIPLLTEYEDAMWKFDQLINDRGVPIDVVAARKSADLVNHAKKQADKHMRELTGRAVPKCSNDAKLVKWLQGRGLNFDTVKKGILDDIIFMASLKEDDTVKEVIDLRRVSKKTSTAKYAAMVACVCEDGNIKGTLRYHGASTGRWAGQLIQPQNFPRVDYDKEHVMLEWLHKLLASNYSAIEIHELIESVHGENSVLQILSRALRSMIKAPEGKQLIGGDFSNIEGRVNTWFADEAWKLQAFKDYDEGRGHDLYKLAYAKSFNTQPETVEDWQRQIGKVQELALGFQGSIGAYVSMSDNYGATPYDLSGPVYEVTPSDTWDLTALQYHQPRTNKYNLKEKEWTAIKILVDKWRAAHPNIVQSWWDYQDAAIEAVSAPHTMVYCGGGRVAYYSDGAALWCVLPSGRALCYPSPELHTETFTYIDKKTGEEKEATRNKVCFWGVDSITKQWKRQSLYGGLQCENIVQATARDIMADRMLGVERAGYPIILTVHDEIVALTDISDTHLNYKDFEHLMSQLPQWADGLPMAVKAWEHERYVK